MDSLNLMLPGNNLLYSQFAQPGLAVGKQELEATVNIGPLTTYVQLDGVTLGRATIAAQQTITRAGGGGGRPYLVRD